MNQDQPTGEPKQSFIAEARREQIIAAAIKTLDEIGFVKASLAKIAKTAGISTALISYHFSDKSDLRDHLLQKLVEDSTTYILERVEKEKTPREKLNVFIEASLAYQGTHPSHNAALFEIIFNARTPENIPYYKLSDDEEEDLILNTLEQILQEGQENGDFGKFSVPVMAKLIQGAIGEYMMVNPSDDEKKVDLETYSEELVAIIKRATAPSSEK